MAMISKYQKRISGPILDRIDMHLDVPRVPVQKLSSLDDGEPSTSIRQGLAMIRMAVERMGLSTRAYHRILKLSCAIADLAGSEQVQQAHLAEALQYRPRAIV